VGPSPVPPTFAPFSSQLDATAISMGIRFAFIRKNTAEKNKLSAWATREAEEKILILMLLILKLIFS